MHRARDGSRSAPEGDHGIVRSLAFLVHGDVLRGKSGSAGTVRAAGKWACSSTRKMTPQGMCSPLEHLVVAHAARGIIGAASVGQGGLRASMLLRVVVLPLDRHGPVKADAVQFDKDLFQAV